MTQHRYPCPSEPPELIQTNGMVAMASGNHQHACIHDAEPQYVQPNTVEHKCDCGMTWRERRPGTMPMPATEEQP